MNILFLTREYKHPLLYKCGGTGVFYSNLAPALVKKGHNIYIFGVNNNSIEFDDNGVKVTFTKSLFKRNLFFNLIRSITGKIKLLEKIHFKIHEYEKKDVANQLYKFVKEKNIQLDIIETHDFEGLSLFLNDSIKYVVRCHGSYSVLAKFFGYKEEKGRMYCEAKAIKKAKNIISISKYNEVINEKLFGVKNFHLIYNGVDTNKFESIKGSELINHSIFFLGNLSVEKGAITAIDNFIDLSKKISSATLHFIGGESEKIKNEIISKATKNNIMNKIHFYGSQDSKNVIKLLSSAHVIIFPSKGENFSLALLEAMSLERRIVVNNISSFQEIVKHEQNGLIVQNNNDFSTQIQKIFSDKKLEEHLSQNARKTVVEKFDISKMINETIEYYNNLK